MPVGSWPGAALARTPEADVLWRLGPVRLGYIDYLNTLPVYFGIEQGIIDLPVAVRRGVPSELNRHFLAGSLDITPISSIEFGRNAARCILLPDLSISADGRVGSILLFHRVPLERVRRVALTTASATSVVLTRIILERHLGLRPDYVRMPPDLGAMLAKADAALIIGDEALLAGQALREGRHPGVEVLDLGEAWKAMTGLPMVYALWVIRSDFAGRSPEGVWLVGRLLQESQAYSWAHRDDLLAEARRRRRLPAAVIDDYFRLIRHEFGPRYREALRTFFEHAHALGELAAVPPLRVWGEEGP